MTRLQNGNRIADINTTRDGEFQVFIGYSEDKDIQRSGMQVIDRKTYKRENAAKNFSNNWING